MSEQRVIKFRAYHGGHDKMSIEPIMLYDEKPGDCLGFVAQGQNIKGLMRSTGLKDDSGKEIFAGDILEHVHSKQLLRWLVEDEIYRFVIVNIGIDGGLHQRFPIIESSHFIDRVVIGNIYQNPELLTHE